MIAGAVQSPAVNYLLNTHCYVAAMTPANLNRRPYPLKGRAVDAIMFILGWALMILPVFLLIG